MCLSFTSVLRPMILAVSPSLPLSLVFIYFYSTGNTCSFSSPMYLYSLFDFFFQFLPSAVSKMVSVLFVPLL